MKPAPTTRMVAFCASTSRNLDAKHVRQMTVGARVSQNSLSPGWPKMNVAARTATDSAAKPPRNAQAAAICFSWALVMASGAAIVEASEKVIDKGRQIAGVALEAAATDIEFKAGRFTIVGTDRGIGIMELAERLRGGMKLPEGVPATLDVSHVHESAPSAYPNGAHVAEVEIDPDTGIIEVVKYTMVGDFGTVINPLLVEGQSHGGVVQGIGQAIMERVAYSEDGQLITGSFTDYALPRAGDVPSFAIGYHSVPATTNVLGAKGCGEAGCAGSLPSVMNALVDALGGRHINMPATPERVWEALNS